MPRIKKIKVKEESLGEISETEKVRKLESLLNVKDVNPFGTEDIESFTTKLEDMTIADMQRLCYDVGLRPMTNKIELKKQLIAQFERTRRSVNNGFQSSAKIPLDTKSPSNSKLLKLISEGL